MSHIDPSKFAELVDPELYDRSGKVFYSGRSAFSSSSPIYLLGLNPGGSPIDQADETIGRSLTMWSERPDRWSEYRDESWRGTQPGTYGIAPRILHLFDRLGLDPHEIPASNVVFVRTNNEAALADEKESLLTKCWPVHRAVIDALGITTVLCLGSTAGRWVRGLLNATDLAGHFIENNARKWTSEAHLSPNGTCVLTLTHPGRVDWTNPAADPTPLIQEMLAR